MMALRALSRGRESAPGSLPAFLIVLLALVPSAGCDRPAPNSSVQSPAIEEAVNPFTDPEAKAFVLVFVRTDCPIANAYAPCLRQIDKRYGPRGVRFWLVYPDPEESEESIRRHLAEYSLPLDHIHDAEHQWVRMTGALVTPEAAVFVPAPGGPQLVYCGRIDDRYVDWGKRRLKATETDLQDTLDTVLGSGRMEFRRTTAVGCAIPALVFNP
jgi:hypothetical protein